MNRILWSGRYKVNLSAQKAPSLWTKRLLFLGTLFFYGCIFCDDQGSMIRDQYIIVHVTDEFTLSEDLCAPVFDVI